MPSRLAAFFGLSAPQNKRKILHRQVEKGQENLSQNQQSLFVASWLVNLADKEQCYIWPLDCSVSMQRGRADREADIRQPSLRTWQERENIFIISDLHLPQMKSEYWKKVPGWTGGLDCKCFQGLITCRQWRTKKGIGLWLQGSREDLQSGYCLIWRR